MYYNQYITYIKHFIITCIIIKINFQTPPPCTGFLQRPHIAHAAPHNAPTALFKTPQRLHSVPIQLAAALSLCNADRQRALYSVSGDCIARTLAICILDPVETL